MPGTRDTFASPSAVSPPYYHDPSLSLGGGRMGRGYLPGSEGLYGAGDVASPSSFQMSMVGGSSTPTAGGNNQAGFELRGRLPPGSGSHMSGIRDLNNYAPVHTIPLDGFPRRLYTVENTLTRDTIVVLTSAHRITLFLLKIKEDEQSASEKFEFVKFHELSMQSHDLEAFTISQNCSITLLPFKLTYALSTRSGKTVFVYDQGSANEVPESLRLEELSEDSPSSAIKSHIIQFAHDYPVTHLAIDAEKEYLACIQTLGTIIVWDINAKVRLAVFNIPNQGVHISFHRSEPYQLMVIDNSGWAQFFNVFRQCCYRSINLIQPNVFSADWSLCNSNIFAAGFDESFTIIDTSKMLSSMNKYYEVPELMINAIKINPADDKVVATLSRLTGIIQLWRDNFGTHIWKHKNMHVNDIAWVHGFPYLLALGHQTLHLYESSVT